MTSFFSRPSTASALEELAAATPLTIFVGAGVSADAGLGEWSNLVENLLKAAAESKGITGENWKAFAASIVKDFGLPASASIAQTVLERQALEQAVGGCLYGQLNYIVEPGNFANNVAMLSMMDDRCTLITLNYDDLLEKALNSKLNEKGLKAVPVVRADHNKAKEIPVIHLHGFKPPQGEPRGELIIGEGDYILMQDPGRWQESLCAERLTTQRCLFVGMSLKDPNLLRYLYLAASREQSSADGERIKGPRHYALFASQTDEEDLGLDVQAAKRQVLLDRWRKMGVAAIECDYLGQAAQFVHEIGLRKRLKKDYDRQSFDKRITTWRSRMDSRKLKASSDEAFIRSQKVLQGTLKEVVERVEALPQIRADDEHLAAHLWVCDPTDWSLECWASSIQLLSKKYALVKQRLELPSGYLAVKAFCSGQRVKGESQLPRSRWTFNMVSPIFLKGGAPWYNLPVGVITLASDSVSTSILAGLRGREVNAVWEILDSYGVRMLTP